MVGLAMPMSFIVNVYMIRGNYGQLQRTWETKSIRKVLMLDFPFPGILSLSSQVIAEEGVLTFTGYPSRRGEADHQLNQLRNSSRKRNRFFRTSNHQTIRLLSSLTKIHMSSLMPRRRRFAP